MSVSTDACFQTLSGLPDPDQTLSLRYVGEERDILNADQLVTVVQGLCEEFAAASGINPPEGSWRYVSSGMARAALSIGDRTIGVERFVGTWPLVGEKSAALLSEIFSPASE